MKKKETQNENSKADYLSTASNLISKTIDFSKIKKEKIQDYIELMQEHQLNCVKIGNFIEAELAKQRVIQLKKIQEKKQYTEAKKRQHVDKKNFNKLKEKEIKEYKKEENGDNDKEEKEEKEYKKMKKENNEEKSEEDDNN